MLSTLLVSSVVLLYLPYIFYFFGLSLYGDALTGILNTRLFAVQGQIFYKYVDFFQKEPLIYFSHIRLFDAWYPFKDILPVLMKHSYGGGNLNSHFWSTEGVASLGIVGIILSSVLVFGVFLIFNSFTASKDKRVIAFLLSSQCIVFCNVPLSVFLLTGGFLLTGFIAYLSKSFSLGTDPRPRQHQVRSKSTPNLMRLRLRKAPHLLG